MLVREEEKQMIKKWDKYIYIYIYIQSLVGEPHLIPFFFNTIHL
jgi:hypothetical protein